MAPDPRCGVAGTPMPGGTASAAAGTAPCEPRWSRHRFPESLYGYGA